MPKCVPMYSASIFMLIISVKNNTCFSVLLMICVIIAT